MKKALWISIVAVLLFSSVAFPLSKNDRIAVMIYERYGYSLSETAGAAESKIIEMLMNAGYKVVDKTRINQIRKTKAAILALKGDVDSILKLGRLYHIDVFVKGRAVMHRARENEFGLYTATASMAVRAYRTKDGRFIFSKTVVSKAVGYTPGEARSKALLKAAKLIGTYLVGLAPSGSSSHVVRSYTLKLQGVYSYEQLNQIIKNLQGIAAVGKVKVMDYHSGSASLEVNYRGSTLSFIDDIQHSLSGLSSVRYSGRVIYIKFE